jgi:hypothetical protein
MWNIRIKSTRIVNVDLVNIMLLTTPFNRTFNNIGLI